MGKDNLDIVLLLSNKTKDDILLKDELEALQSMNTEHLKVFHTLTRHNSDIHGEWKGLQGRVTAKMVKECGFPEPGEDTLIAYSGPKGFNRTV